MKPRFVWLHRPSLVLSPIAQAGSMCDKQFISISPILLAALDLLSHVGVGLLKSEIVSSMPLASCLQHTFWWAMTR